MIVCPLCEKNDKFEKISSIVYGGTQNMVGETESWVSGDYSIATGQHDGGHWETVPVTGTRMSELARKLAITPEPKKPLISCFTWGLILSAIPAALVSIGSICLMVVSSSAGNSNNMMPVQLFSIAVTVGLILFIFYSIKTSRTKYTVEKPKWDKAKVVWDRLYFCFRDYKIYDPESHTTLDVQYLHEYIFTR